MSGSGETWQGRQQRVRGRGAVEQLLAAADVRLNGERPWDMQVSDERVYARILAEGSLGAGEAYMDGWWDCRQLDELFARLLRSRIHERVRPWPVIWHSLVARFLNRQRGHRAWDVGRRHYDIGDDLYERMLDRRMIYSCGFWDGARNLDESQERKLRLIFDKLALAPGQRVLDIGCGWGGAARYAAEHYGVEVTGVTVSEHQAGRARALCADWPVDILLCDYRDLPGHIERPFDAAYSIGMFEHVGHHNYERYMRVVRECLTDSGLFLLHTIGNDRPATTADPWIERYVFPNSMLPSASQLAPAFERYFVLEDWQNFGTDYDRTLMAWYRRFRDSWDVLGHRYDQRFYRMWSYYLLSSAGAFRARSNQLWQLVLSPSGLKDGYRRSEREARFAAARARVGAGREPAG
jgi:cyclopropane-fatty-acyl-phospholipid synthase